MLNSLAVMSLAASISDAHKRNRVYQEGYDARVAGVKYWDNPHMRKSWDDSWKDQDSWSEGWMRADELLRPHEKSDRRFYNGGQDERK